MKKLNFWEKAENRKVGEECRQLRKNAGYTQEDLVYLFREYYNEELGKLGFSIEECYNYLKSECNEELCKRLRQKGIEPNCYLQIAKSTISAYENGTRAVPYYYVKLLQLVIESFGTK